MTAATVSPALAVISAMITPALLILGSASLIATALVRMARVVDRSRVVILAVKSGSKQPDLHRTSLIRHERRARFAGRCIAALFSAVALFVADGLAIAADHYAGNVIAWLPIALTILGMLLMLAGAGYMLADSWLASEQISEEIAAGRKLLVAL